VFYSLAPNFGTFLRHPVLCEIGVILYLYMMAKNTYPKATSNYLL